MALSKPEIDEDALSFRVIVEKVGGLDISVQDPSLVDMPQRVEQTSEVVSHIVDQKISIV